MDGDTCPYCKAALQPGSKFCEACGKRVEGAANCAAPAAVGTVLRPFDLSVALPSAMQVGRRSILAIRFRAYDDIYESVEFVLRNGVEVIGRTACCFGRPLAVEHRVDLAVTPKTCGTARLDLDVVCHVGTAGDTEIHTAALQVTVDARQATTFSPVFNISQNQTADRAGDSKGGDVNVNFGGLQLQQEEDTSRYETPHDGFSPLAVQLASSPERLTLQCGDESLQLVSDDIVTFGRNRDNTIPLRVYGSDGRIDLSANDNNVSRFHFRIERRDCDCIVLDGSESAPSAYGTRVDGVPVPPTGAIRLVAGRDAEIEAGREGVAIKMPVRFYRDTWGRSAGLTIKRSDGARQRVCVVWRDVPLCDEARVSWTGRCWMLITGASVPVPLAVGMAVSIEGKQFVVLPFRKTHVK